MRCHAFLRVLAERHRVFLLVLNHRRRSRTIADVQRALRGDRLRSRRTVGSAGRADPSRRRARAAVYRRCYRRAAGMGAARDTRAFPYPFARASSRLLTSFGFYIAPVLDRLAASGDVAARIARPRRARVVHPPRGSRHLSAAAAIVRRGARHHRGATVRRARACAACGAFDQACSSASAVERAACASVLHAAPEVAPNVIAESARRRRSDAKAMTHGGAGSHGPGRRDRPFRFPLRRHPRLRAERDAVGQFAFTCCRGYARAGCGTRFDASGRIAAASRTRSRRPALTYACTASCPIWPGLPRRRCGRRTAACRRRHAHQGSRGVRARTPRGRDGGGRRGHRRRHERDLLIGEVVADSPTTARGWCASRISPPLSRHARHLVRARHSDAVLRDGSSRRSATSTRDDVTLMSR